MPGVVRKRRGRRDEQSGGRERGRLMCKGSLAGGVPLLMSGRLLWPVQLGVDLISRVVVVEVVVVVVELVSSSSSSSSRP